MSIKKINAKQLVIVWGAAALILAACLFPPWNYTFRAPQNSGYIRPAGYHLLFNPPAPDRNTGYSGVTLAYGRLVVELIGIIAVAIACLVTVGGSESSRSRQEQTSS